MYEIKFSKQAVKDLKHIPEGYKKNVLDKIELLGQDPYGKLLDTKKLRGVDGYRLRVGEYRVLYKMENQTVVVKIIKIKVRGSIYG